MARLSRVLSFYFILVAIMTFSLTRPKTVYQEGKSLTKEQVEQYRESMKEASNNTLSEEYLNALVEVYVERNTIEDGEIKIDGMEFRRAVTTSLIMSAFLIGGVWIFVIYLKNKRNDF